MPHACDCDPNEFKDLRQIHVVNLYSVTVLPSRCDVVFSTVQCSLSCGGGVRRRNVTCSRNTGVDCDPQKKPPSVTTCSIQDCPQVLDNFEMDWSGSGWSSKEVLNEINFIPEAKPLPKYSSTRVQPPNHKEVNDVIEGDFHYHNNIENINQSPENSVQVDDFYYDYNFINFHEDLSDDFESEGKDSEDSRIIGTPTQSTKETAYTESTNSPTATSAIITIPKATTHSTLHTKEPEDTDLGLTEGNMSARTTNSDNLDDFLSEDFLLPVSTTRSPPLHPTLYTQTLKERQDTQRTTKDPRQDGIHGAEVENKYDNFTEDLITDNVTVTHKHPPFHGNQSSTNIIFTTTMSSQEMVEHDVNVYSYNEESTLVPAEQEDIDSPAPTQETLVNHVQLDKIASEIPQTSSPSLTFPTESISEDLDLDQSHFNTAYVTRQYSWDTDTDLSTASLYASEEPTTASLPFLQTSGIQEAVDISMTTGTENIPPTELEGALQTSPADLLPTTRIYNQTEPSFSERTGTESSSQAPLFVLAHFDNNEIVTPMTVNSSSHGLPINTTASPQQSTTISAHKESPATSTHTPLPVPTSVQATASTRITFTGYWITSNWSAVSLHEMYLLDQSVIFILLSRHPVLECKFFETPFNPYYT